MSLFFDSVKNPTPKEMCTENKVLAVDIAAKYAIAKEDKIPTFTDRELLEAIYRELLLVKIKLESL